MGRRHGSVASKDEEGVGVGGIPAVTGTGRRRLLSVALRVW